MKSEIPKIDPIIDNIVLPEFLESQRLAIVSEINEKFNSKKIDIIADVIYSRTWIYERNKDLSDCDHNWIEEEYRWGCGSDVHTICTKCRRCK